ncbi:MAG TPA: pilin [Mycobacterium sp.]|nr:pilin [Mycobacterium sp.]HME49626.1 pilin [Mycobacterium sp.]
MAAGTARAEPIFAPQYHWCPGDLDPGWGFNWDAGDCHDDHYRDRDADDHSHDWWGGPPPPPAPWQPWALGRAAKPNAGNRTGPGASSYRYVSRPRDLPRRRPVTCPG